MQFKGILITLFFIVCLGCGSPSGTTDNNVTVELQGSTSDLQASASSVLVSCESDNPDNNEQCIQITLPCTEHSEYGKAGWYHHTCTDEVIKIPNGRPIYAFLVNGFDQNHNLDMFHFYNFAKCIFRRTQHHEKKSYVHYAWWNNLLAPYMEKPLHNVASVPSLGGALNAIPDYLGFIYDPNVDPFWKRVPTKAIPAEDYQFQKDAKTVLEAIRHHNPDAAIILVGHSMGGDAVIRLADSMPEDFEIDLVAPIDPVGNRTCLPNGPDMKPVQMSWDNTTCYGAHTFTRFRATHTDWYIEPYRISFEDNKIEYLYHRWQNEAAYPLDWGCPYNAVLCPIWGSLNIHPFDYMFDWLDVVNIFRPIPADEVQLPDRYLFRHNDPRSTGINQGSTNVQEAIQMNDESGTDVFPDPQYYWNWGGWSDGHGEIVGFRALKPNVVPPQSYPLALAAQNWPRGEDCLSDKSDTECRVYHLKKWETDSHYLDNKLLAPQKPPKAYCDERGFAYCSDYCTYCMVSGDLCEILRTSVDIPGIPADSGPVANAGPDQTVECSGPDGALVTLDGSGSTGFNCDSLTYTWYLPDGVMTGMIIDVDIPLGTHTITLKVDDGDKTDTDTVDITVQDTTAPTLSISLSPDVLWPPNHKLVTITTSVDVSDTCDNSPKVELVSITSNEADDEKGDGYTSEDIQGSDFGTDDREFLLRAERSGEGTGRIYTVNYEATDALGNVVGSTAEVIVPHDHGGI